MKLIHFTAEWCVPCKAMKPVISKFLESNPNIEYEKIDIDQNPEAAKAEGVLGVPTFIAYNGDNRKSITGAAPLVRLERLIEDVR